MKNAFLSLTLLTASLGWTTANCLAAPPAFFTNAASSQGVKWQADLPTAHKLAVSENKPILIVFGAEWCGYCKKLERQTINTPEMSKYINENFVAVHLDLDKEKKIGEILEVTALPCTIVLSPNADLLGRINGYHTAIPYQKNLVAAQELFQPSQAVTPTDAVLR